MGHTLAYFAMPFGFCNALVKFQRVMMASLQDFIQKLVEIFLDDFSIQGDIDDMPNKLDQVFEQ